VPKSLSSNAWNYREEKKRILTYRGRVNRYVSCLLILKYPLYTQVRIHFALSVPPSSPSPRYFSPHTDDIYNNTMRARILSISFANVSRTRREPRQGWTKGRGEVKATMNEGAF